MPGTAARIKELAIPANGRVPADVVEQLSKQCAADEAADEVAREINAALLTLIRSRGTRRTKPVAVACAKKVPAPTSTMPVNTAGRLDVSSNGRPSAATASEPHMVGRVPRRATALPAKGVVTIDGKNTKYTRPSVIVLIISGDCTSTKLT